jgi:predicted ArsR family transcriptional regulator
MRAGRGDNQGDLGRVAASGNRRGFGLADIRAANRECVLVALERDGPLSRIALARRLGLSRTTVGSIVTDLLREGRVREDGVVPASESGGRRATLLRVCEARAGQDSEC